MGQSLVIVESPAKAKTIGKYLGKTFAVKASVGHIKDLPKSKLGVDIEHDFEPTYQVISGKKKTITELKKAAKNAEAIYLALDPDREGEAIAWHIAEELSAPKKSQKKVAVDGRIRRILFNEITKQAINEAIQKPLELDVHLYEAQQARRILDRLVGYQISPLLWDKVQRGLSAGRVQSVALRLVCEREREIRAFKSQEYWTLHAKLEGSALPVFEAKLAKVKGEKADLANEAAVQALTEKMQGKPFVLQKVIKKERKRNPTPPFITSTLQQEAARKLGFTAKRTMATAQSLYEGVELKGEGAVGLITYMRTDSTRMAESAVEQVRELISERFGKDFLPDKPNVYKSKKASQDAHEAIRPTDANYDPDTIKGQLSRDQYRLYKLIWQRFVACQMSPAVLDQTTFEIEVETLQFRASGSVIRFPGFMQLYIEGTDEESGSELGEKEQLPDLKEGETLKLHELRPDQHFTEPPPRYSEASLIKDLEQKGIGRPSTYAAILSNIEDKKYVRKEEKRLFPTDLGMIINDLLVENFPNVMDVEFTARMEKELDEVEEGNRGMVETLREFYGPFAKNLKLAKEQMRSLKGQETPTDLKCGQCQSPLVIKWGRQGEFLACTGYPECRFTQEFTRGEDGEIIPAKREMTGEFCSKCGSPMIIKRGRFGTFLACSKYPDCKNTASLSIGVDCPQCGAKLVERRSKRGKPFFGCSSYPKCNFASWNRPVNEKCPDCGSKYLVEKESKKTGPLIVCPEKECDYTRAAEKSQG